MIPKPFGFDININCRRRVAKKHINRYERGLYKRFYQFTNYPKDGIISDCTGLNMKIIKIEPVYHSIGRKSRVLVDFDIVGLTNSCSFHHCGIDLPKTCEECQGYVKYILSKYSENDKFGFYKRYSEITLNEDGTFEYAKLE